MATLPSSPHSVRLVWRPLDIDDLAYVAALEAQILNISVVPDVRRQGLGRALLLQFLDDARIGGAEQCFLEVRVSNVPAIMLYEGAGFVPVARRNNYYPPAAPGLPREDALVMRRALTRLHSI